MQKNNLVYSLPDGKTYINVTNACTNACVFCVRDIKDDVAGSNLWLENDNVTAADIIEQFENFSTKEHISDVITFCGYGEPLLKLDVVKEVCEYIKEKFPNSKIKVNTNGHASFVHKKNVPAELKGLVDCFSISLNAQNETLYNEISKPNFKDAYAAVLEFAKQCKDAEIETVMSVVDGFDSAVKINVEECAQIAAKAGADFRIRNWIKEGY